VLSAVYLMNVWVIFFLQKRDAREAAELQDAAVDYSPRGHEHIILDRKEPKTNPEI
jgi:hypothetical protein